MRRRRGEGEPAKMRSESARGGERRECARGVWREGARGRGGGGGRCTNIIMGGIAMLVASLSLIVEFQLSVAYFLLIVVFRSKGVVSFCYYLTDNIIAP